MIGKFIAPAGAGTPSNKGIYLITNSTPPSATYNNATVFNSIGLLNGSNLSVNTSFTISGNGFVRDSTTSTAVVFKMAQQSDSKIVVVGIFSRYQTGTSGGITRINLDGSIDSTFNSGGLGFGTNFTYSVLIQPDGKILACGEFTTYNSVAANRIVRINPDGSRDTSFNIGTGFNTTVRCIAIQPDGKILAGGTFTTYNGVTANRIIRLNSDGSIDSSFNTGTGFSNNQVNDIKIQSDGKIYVAGNFSGYNGVSTAATNSFLRLNSNGSLDSTFNKTLSFGSQIYTICIQSDGKVIVGGNYCPGGPSLPCGIIRFNADGSLDNIFVKPGFYSSPDIRSILQQPDGKLLIFGDFSKYETAYSTNAIRINLNGSIDSSVVQFNENSARSSGLFTLYDAMLLGSGDVLTCGGEGFVGTNYNYSNVCRLSSYNTMDSDLGLDGLVSPTSSLIKQVVTDSGNIFISGLTLRKINSPINFVKLDQYLKPNQDDIFKKGLLVTNIGNSQSVSVVIKDSSDKILVGGEIREYDTTKVNGIFRINQDGSIDSSFNVLGAFSLGSFPIGITEDENSKYYVFGQWTTYGGSAAAGIVRLNNNGIRDNTFSIASYTFIITQRINCVQIQPDGKLIVTGNFTSFGATARRFICRLNTNGTLDSTFDPVQSFFLDTFTNTDAIPNVIRIQSDGKIIAGGLFTQYNGISYNRIVRINPNGSQDTSFNVGTGFDEAVDDIVIGSDGRIYVAGGFRRYNGNPCYGYCVLEPDGSFVPTGILFGSRLRSVFIKE